MVRLRYLLNGLVLGISILAIPVSCDLLAPQAIQIVGFGPQADSVDAGAVQTVWVEFSRDVDHAKAENAFSLKENGAILTGSFSWEGKRLALAPFRPLLNGQLYEMALGMGVEDSSGVSMEQEFLKRFSTKSEIERPRVELVWHDGSVFSQSMAIVDRQPILRFQFSEAVDRSSFYGAFSWSPTPRFSYDWTSNDTVCEIRPVDQLLWQTDYHVVLRDSLRDLAGNTVMAGIDRWFHVGGEQVAPFPQTVWNTINGNKGTRSLVERTMVADSVGFDGSWERDWGFDIEFSEPVQRSGLEGLITFEPPIGYTFANTGDLVERVVLTPTARFSANTLYTLTIRPGIKDCQDNVSTLPYRFRWYTDGPLTVSPRLTAFCLRINPVEPLALYAQVKGDHSSDYQVIDLGAFAPMATVRTYVDLYFSLASGATIDALSVLSNFSVTATNSSASVLPVAYQIGTIVNPEPQIITGMQVMRIFLDLTNQVASGLMVFHLHSGFKDSRGNAAEVDGQWPVLK